MVLPPVIAVPGETPTLRSMVVAPVLVTVEPASTENAEAVPSGTTVAAAWALLASGPARNNAIRALAEVIRTLWWRTASGNTEGIAAGSSGREWWRPTRVRREK
jgi:hypothetical protein